jgi:DNA-directed RNA polymerase I, II, and III subunit RPABC5
MLIPIRCFTCGKVLADKYDYYVRQVEALKLQSAGGTGNEASTSAAPKKTKASKASVSAPAAEPTPYFDTVKTNDIMDSLGLTRYCCRRHMLGTVDMMETI